MAMISTGRSADGWWSVVMNTDGTWPSMEKYGYPCWTMAEAAAWEFCEWRAGL